MNKSDKLFVGFFLALVCSVLFVSYSQASVVARGPKKSTTISYTTAISSITPFTVLEATNTVEDKPGAVYSVILSTGAAGDYMILFDSCPYSAVSLNTANASNIYTLTSRLYFSSTTQNTQFVFDPPLIFYHGLLAIQSAAGNAYTVIWEPGRGLSGQ